MEFNCPNQSLESWPVLADMILCVIQHQSNVKMHALTDPPTPLSYLSVFLQACTQLLLFFPCFAGD